MRTLLLAALSLSALTPSRSDACGNYRPEPRVMRLSTHFIVDRATDRRRTFVLYGDAPAAERSWRMLAPMSYDATQIADGERLANPVTFTLVGETGTRVVASTKHVYLSKSWDFERPQHAMDLGDVEGFAVAIEGKHEHAAWIALEERTHSQRAIARWVTAHGITPYDGASIYVSRVAGTDFETVSVFPKNGKKMLTFLKHGDREIGRYNGTAMGAVSIDGITNLVIVDGAQTRQVFLSNGLI